MTTDSEAEDAPHSELYYTSHKCSGCGTTVHGLHGRWTCSVCGTCSPYAPPPDGWQADPGYDAWT
ncbi:MULTISPECIES: hypothetical protein [Streptomyces]|uniref:hypothetical protein n=1 Tax=Streptomyces TaxID=1883 RepID=UPI000995E854|nr:hypothetical protein [Streptomyces noursei]